ncbi:bifunctional NAD(P)H-hydrate repair enzyme [Betaproteobacteria bacterium]|nr:bifunctional NAD(P)H-hydrate repair enzyme [Betaproteobacteria bacterium]
MPLQAVYPVAAIRRIEAHYLPTAQPPLMERAGQAAAADALRLCANRSGPVLIACGPGNNGGDGFVLAHELRRHGREVVVAFAADPARLPADAAQAHAAYLRSGGDTVAELPAPPADGWALVVDALFGIGLNSPIEGFYRGWIEALNALPAPRLAIDLPSGLDADSGRLLGATFHASHTATFIALKPGLLTLNGPDVCGEITVHPLDLDAPGVCPPPAQVITPALFAAWLKPRRRNSHKGTYGDAAVLGGASGMTGAALLAARAALWLGAGRVYAALIDPAAAVVDMSHPELMLRPADELPEHLDALAIGPGLGASTTAERLLENALRRETALVLDADALNLIARTPHLAAALPRRTGPTVLTPHPAEAGRLLDTSTAAVQSNRLKAVLELAHRYHATVVLKGCGSLVASADGRWFVNTSGHPGMASAGMGDVLTGLVLGLLAQGWPAETALIAAVHLHGAAADQLARTGVGPVGLTAGELIGAARALFNIWLNDVQPPRHHHDPKTPP